MRASPRGNINTNNIYTVNDRSNSKRGGKMFQTEDGLLIDVNAQMEEEKDAQGKLDLDTASAAAVVGAGLTMQDKAKQAMGRINYELD